MNEWRAQQGKSELEQLAAGLSLSGASLPNPALGGRAGMPPFPPGADWQSVMPQQPMQPLGAQHSLHSQLLHPNHMHGAIGMPPLPPSGGGFSGGHGTAVGGRGGRRSLSSGGGMGSKGGGKGGGRGRDAAAETLIGSGLSIAAPEFNANAPVFDPRSSARFGSGFAPPSGLSAGRSSELDAGTCYSCGATMSVPTGMDEETPAPPVLSTSASLRMAAPPPLRQFTPGAALAGLARTGQSGRMDAFFSPHTLRQEAARRRAAALDTGDMSDFTTAALAGYTVRGYHSLVPLDDPSTLHQYDAAARLQPSAPYVGVRTGSDGGSSVTGSSDTASRLRSLVCKATSASDGEAYALRRMEGPPAPTEQLAAAATWCRFRHPGMVRLIEVFNEEGPDGAGNVGRATYFVNELFPGAISLDRAYFGGGGMVPSEERLWSIALPLLALMHAAHSAGAALRCIDAKHVLLTDEHTARLAAVGVLDAMRQNDGNIPALQSADLRSLGGLLVAIACQSRGAGAPEAVAKSMAYIRASFSTELTQLILLLLSQSTGTVTHTVHDAVALVSGRMMTRMSQMQAYTDALTMELAKEAENGRLLRLLCKLSAAGVRRSLPNNENFGDHPDRYLLRLFMENVFGASDEEGRPAITFAQIVHSLNKLDVGHEGRAMLTGREDGSLLLVSHGEIKQVLERSFAEIAAAAEL